VQSVAVFSCCRYCTLHTPCCRINKLLTSILAPAVEASSPDGVRLALKIQKRHDEEAGVTGPLIGREQVSCAISARSSRGSAQPSPIRPSDGGPEARRGKNRPPAGTDPCSPGTTCKERAPINNFPQQDLPTFLPTSTTQARHHHTTLLNTTRHTSCLLPLCSSSIPASHSSPVLLSN
jgi:hypothetical protein